MLKNFNFEEEKTVTKIEKIRLVPAVVRIFLLSRVAFIFGHLVKIRKTDETE